MAQNKSTKPKTKRVKIHNSQISHAVNRYARQNATKPKASKTVTFNVSFFQREARSRPHKKCAIYMRLYNGRINKEQFSVGISCKPCQFEQSTASIKDDPNGTKLLATIKAKAIECYTDLKLTNRPIDLRVIKAYALGDTIEGVPNIGECFQKFWNEVVENQLKAGELQVNTRRGLKVKHNHLLKFIEERHGSHAHLSIIVPADAQACVLWLKKNKDLSNDVAMRITAHFKRVLEYATANEWIQRNPFMLFRKKMENKRKESLTLKEVTAIENAVFASEVLNQVRDIFLFSCYTSLAYQELSTLSPSHITEVNGQSCILQVRDKIKNKTNLPSIIPLRSEALEILKRYRQHPVCIKKGVCLPVQANQKVNTYLKHIQHIAGLTKRLTTHVARRTAATLYLNDGMPITSVSAMLGHSDLRTTTQHYTTVNPETVVRDFQEVVSKRNIKRG